MGRAPRAEDPCQNFFSELANYNTILGGARERGVWGSGPLFKIIMVGVIKSFKGSPQLEHILRYFYVHGTHTQHAHKARNAHVRGSSLENQSGCTPQLCVLLHLMVMGDR